MKRSQVLGGLSLSTELESMAFGLVHIEGACVASSSAALSQQVEHGLLETQSQVVARKDSVRNMLRFGKYKPTGRGKPASEYLIRAAEAGRFPSINNLVDINNLVSLQSQFPISLIDLDRAGSNAFVLRRGRAGEQYIFNSADQVIDLEDLVLVARMPDDAACANPIKDSMTTKLNDESKNVLAVLYVPAELRSSIPQATARFCELAKAHSGADRVTSAVL